MQMGKPVQRTGMKPVLYTNNAGMTDMADDEIMECLNGIFRDVFEDSAITLTPATTPDDIAAWDSMSNITLAIEIEQRFGIRVKTAEMEALQNIADLVALVRAQMAPAAS